MVHSLVVDGFVVGLAVKLGFQQEKLKGNVLVLMAFDVGKRWLEGGGL